MNANKQLFRRVLLDRVALAVIFLLFVAATLFIAIAVKAGNFTLNTECKVLVCAYYLISCLLLVRTITRIGTFCQLFFALLLAGMTGLCLVTILVPENALFFYFGGITEMLQDWLTFPRQAGWVIQIFGVVAAATCVLLVAEILVRRISYYLLIYALFFTAIAVSVRVVPVWTSLCLHMSAVGFLVILQRALFRVSSNHLMREFVCYNCGYNLSGTRSGICSECGARLHSPGRGSDEIS